MHLRKMSRQNEASIARHRALVERLSNINPDVRDARNRLLPDIETRRAAFRGDVEFRARLAEERFTRIEASLADAVPFRDFGTREFDPDEDAAAAAAAAAEEEDRHALYRPRQQRHRGRSRASRREEPDAPQGGILASLRREASDTAASSSATHFSRTRAPSVVARRREPDGAFHDGKARAAMARAQAHRAAFAAEAAAKRRAREDARRVAGDADAVETGDAENDAGTPTSRASSGATEHREDAVASESDRVGRLARLRATARARFSKAGRAVAMGLRAANALEDASAEGRAARRAEREASAATETAAKAQHALGEATRSSTLAKRALDAANEALAEAEARAAEAGGVAARARDIADELRADGQLDAAALAEKNVEAWRARARADETSAEDLREKRDGLLEAFESREARRLEAEETHAAEEATARAARDAAETEEARAADSRAARAVVMKRVAREVLVRVRRAGDEGSAEEESSDGDESSDSDTPDKKARGSRKVARRKRETSQDVRPSKPSRAETRRVAMRAAAAEATAVGVCQRAESLARRASLAALADARRRQRWARPPPPTPPTVASSRGAALASARRRGRARVSGTRRSPCAAGARESGETTFWRRRAGRRLRRLPSSAHRQGRHAAFGRKPGLRGARRLGRGLSRTKRRGRPPRRRAGGLVARSPPRAGRPPPTRETRASAAADAAAASAAAGNVRPDASRFDTLPESAFSSPSRYDEDREDDRNRDRERDGSSARDRRGSIGAARRAARGATAESIAEWARRARDKGLVPVADPGSNVSEAAGETSVTTHRHRPVQGSRPAPSSEGAFNSVFRPRAEREAPRPDPPLSAETETTPGKTPRATQTQTQTQLLGRFVRAQRACARAELVTARAFRERRDARLSARRLHDVADALALAVPAADASRRATERACAAGLAALAEGEAKYVEACLSQGPRRARVAKLARAEGATPRAPPRPRKSTRVRSDVHAKTRALAEARASSASAADALPPRARRRARGGGGARWVRVLRARAQPRARRSTHAR